MRYQVHLLKDTERPGSPRLVDFCRSDLGHQLSESEQVFGIFLPLFGLASNELYVVTCGEEATTPNLSDGMKLLETHRFRPTIRPTNHEPPQKAGVYVFRWFQVNPETVDEIVELSGDAWPDFERTFDSQIQGLFVEESDTPEQMLLLTWYRDLSVWEASRHPPETSRDNFLRRHQLTREAKPIATVLSLENPGKQGLISHN